ncbi:MULTISPECIES: type IV secretory system conjugative DNA transfer family protein [Gluconobacter]|uniref:type IV secretory system conjugative DNA transfer family protein n=1 Tax=Gluconobacter TaxID=441 RepID=UPI001B8AEA48|nr:MULTISPECIES: type IV secretion system DNA-binding domain-containing protein [Gluconobacter]MBS1058177.1 type IV secretion system DNA-binding domain-containing protein [Gluconobacter kondonii]MCP1274442.1 type IV secretion system DNA-binding domain-containing protein [Gluconobacter albidus]
MTARKIGAPLGHQQVERGKTYRDTRPFWTKAKEELRSPLAGWLGFVAVGLGWFVPALDGALILAAPAVAAWVVLRPERLPLHMPRYSGLKDANDLNPKDRKARQANGILYLGTEARTRRQLWMSSDAARQHAAIPGTTGSGKTTAIVSLITNALAHGSGCILVDAKGDNTVYGDVLALARRFGLDDQVLALNFLAASGTRDSNTFNPFATGNADAIREMLVSQLGEQSANDSNGVFRDRAVGLIGTVVPALVWMRDTHGIPINIDAIRYATDLRWIGTLARHKVFLIRNPGSNQAIERRVEDIPDDVLWPLQAYLGELPGYDSSLEWNAQKENKPSEQHGYAKMYFSRVFTQLGVSLGHIFNAETADIIMRDVVLNRRILIVILPSLENSSDSLAGLGKIVVASLRGVMAQLLGAKLHGSASEVFKLKAGAGDAPFQIFFDELAAYVTDGMDRMLAMGRGLNCMFWISFQDLPGLTARIGEKAFSLLGNANLTHALRLQDAMKTREWLEQQADKVEVTQATRVENDGYGYYNGSGAEVREVSRLPWNDLQSLIEGEAVTMFGGRVIHSKTFFADINGRSGEVRRARPVMLPSPKTGHGVDPDAETWDIVETLENGDFQIETASSAFPPAVAALIGRIANENHRDSKALMGDVSTSLTDLTAFLRATTAHGHGEGNTPFAGMLAWGRFQRDDNKDESLVPAQPMDGAFLGQVEQLERLVGSRTGRTPRRRAVLVLATRDQLHALPANTDGAKGASEREILAAFRTLGERLQA